MRVYFHLAASSKALRDDIGIDVVDVEEARTQALRALEELREADTASGMEWRGWRLDIADGSGAVLVSINLDAIGH